MQRSLMISSAHFLFFSRASGGASNKSTCIAKVRDCEIIVPPPQPRRAFHTMKGLERGVWLAFAEAEEHPQLVVVISEHLKGSEVSTYPVSWERCLSALPDTIALRLIAPRLLSQCAVAQIWRFLLCSHRACCVVDRSCRSSLILCWGLLTLSIAIPFSLSYAQTLTLRLSSETARPLSARRSLGLVPAGSGSLAEMFPVPKTKRLTHPLLGGIVIYILFAWFDSRKGAVYGRTIQTTFHQSKETKSHLHQVMW